MTDDSEQRKPAKQRAPMKIVGDCICPSCEREVPLKEQSTGFACISCNWCGFQAYARNAEADQQMRKKWLKPTKPAANKPKPEEKSSIW